MLTLLHDDKYGFGLEMTQYDTWKNVFRFPTTVDLASRSSWTIGAAALIARHGHLSLCPKDGSTGPVFNSTLDVPVVAELTTNIHTPSQDTCELVQEPIHVTGYNPLTADTYN
ncbi:hypothetical protein H0H93_004548, partial [Arthromyces matolae]